MPKVSHPKHGSMQYWPHRRCKHSLARIRTWSPESKAKLLGFIGYKVGMTHVIATDNRPKSLTKGEKIALAVTVLDCPPMMLVGAVFYTPSLDGWKKSSFIMAGKTAKELDRIIPLPKKTGKGLETVTSFEDVRLLVHSQPVLTGMGTKKPKLLEIALGGSKEDKLNFVKNNLGKEISIKDVFDQGIQVDVHGITKGKGFQGTVKRYGVPIRQHKAEKTKRGIATLGSWTPKRVEFTVAQSGKMGFHMRTEYNKHLLKIGEKGSEVTPVSGFHKYGVLRNNYILLQGSVVGPHKRPVVLTPSVRPNRKIPKEVPEISFIAK